MLKKCLIALILALIVVFGVLAIPKTSSQTKTQDEPILVEIDVEIDEVKLTHRQETWIRVLEWCESGGKPEAINKVDLDGTPSYGAFQFKPSTFDYFSKKYGIEGELMDRDTQYAIVYQMVLERDNIQWNKQFPDCVKKFGYPPKP